MKIIILPIIIFVGMITNAQTSIEVKPDNIYKEIDVARHNNAIAILSCEDKVLKVQIVLDILANPNYYNPPVLYALSKELFSERKKDDACFWFYVGQLRARYDANLCMDNTAKGAVSNLTRMYGEEINKYAIKNLDELEITVQKVVDFVKNNDENYDHRWINLHGMDAMISGLDTNSVPKELSQPKEKWAEIKLKTIEDYHANFREALESMRNK